jgi:hypothetical protein
LFAACGALCSSAAADAAVGSLRAPRVSSKYHVEFQLHDRGWSQIVGAMAGTPALGRYAKDLPVSVGGCRVTADVDADATAHKPLIDGRRVTLRPGSRAERPLTYSSTGLHGPVRWWSGHSGRVRWYAGHSAGDVAAAGGFQRAPEGIRTKTRPWVVFNVHVTYLATAGPAINKQCETLSRALAPRIESRVARTMHLKAGAPKPHGPYLTA